MISTDLPPWLRQAVDEQLLPGEALVRLEQPDPDRLDIAGGKMQIGLGAAILAGAIYFAAVGNVGGAIFCGLMACPFLLSRQRLRWETRRVAYAITDCRALIVSVSMLGKVWIRSLGPDVLKPEIHYDESDGNWIQLNVDDAEIDEQPRLLVNFRALRNASATQAALTVLIESHHR